MTPDAPRPTPISPPVGASTAQGVGAGLDGDGAAAGLAVALGRLDEALETADRAARREATTVRAGLAELRGLLAQPEASHGEAERGASR